ncbi:MAG: hypothetical protein P1U80_11200 [Pseudomonadales bacterium]|nr:hypothetical protein [Pseudomonadales bacterium]
MADVIERCGFLSLEIKKHQNPFAALTRSIVCQQLSGRATGTIHQRILELYPAKNRITAKNFLRVSEEQVRAAGISANKFRAITDLAEKTVDGFIPGYSGLNKMDDQEVVDLLTD